MRASVARRCWLHALSPLDGRYHKALGGFRDVFSEHALIRQRVFVEVQWLVHVVENSVSFNCLLHCGRGIA